MRKFVAVIKPLGLLKVACVTISGLAAILSVMFAVYAVLAVLWPPHGATISGGSSPILIASDNNSWLHLFLVIFSLSALLSAVFYFAAKNIKSKEVT